MLDEAGSLCFRVGSCETRSSIELQRYQWYNLGFVVNRLASTIGIKALAKARDVGESDVVIEEEHQSNSTPAFSARGNLVIAAESNGSRVASHRIKSSTFNGKIDGFRLETIFNGETKTTLDLDFSLDIPSDQVSDISGNDKRYDSINAPASVVTSHNWDANHNDWTRASYGIWCYTFSPRRPRRCGLGD